MFEPIQQLQGASRTNQYETLLPQITALIEGEKDLIANLANISAAIKSALGFFWVGFYLVKKEELVLGPFQGPIACTRISYDKGVCGKAWATKKMILVDDVEKFPGHISCNASSQSEIVFPILKNGTVSIILDIDSDKKSDFDDVDVKFLTQIAELVEGLQQ